MRNSVRLLLGLSMPGLVLVALWLWSSRRGNSRNYQIRPQKQDDLQNSYCENGTSRRSSLNGSAFCSGASNFNCTQTNNVVSGNDFTHGSGSETMSENHIDKKHCTRKMKCASSRTQSLDEHSDMSSVDGQSPLDRKVASTTDSDIEFREGDFDDEVTWEVEFPQALCGRLIGKKGKNVQKISQITGAKIRLIPQKENTESSQRLVSLTGSRKQIKSALRALREKFPSVPFTRLNGSTPYAETNYLECLTSSNGYVVLPENELCQIFVANIVDANHFYAQLYDQGHLRSLDQQMYQCYGSTAGAMVPQAINAGMLCASLSPSGWWLRAQVVGLSMNSHEVEITWLDYGGRASVHISMLRKLRSDFLQLPFQAVECYLSNIVPNHGESSFSMAACALLEHFTQNGILTARVTSYIRGCPHLELYSLDQWTGQSTFVNREFIRRGFARWSET